MSGSVRQRLHSDDKTATMDNHDAHFCFLLHRSYSSEDQMVILNLEDSELKRTANLNEETVQVVLYAETVAFAAS